MRRLALGVVLGYVAGGVVAMSNMKRRYEAMLDAIQGAIDEGHPDNDSDTVQQIDNILMGRP